jgi:hypothetical protein
VLLSSTTTDATVKGSNNASLRGRKTTSNKSVNKCRKSCTRHGTPLLAYLPAHQNASWCWHLLLSAQKAHAPIIAFPLRLGWPEKVPSTMEHHEISTARAQHLMRNISSNNIQIGNLMPLSHLWVRGFHALTSGRYLFWCQPRRCLMWLYTTTLIPTSLAMPTIAGAISTSRSFLYVVVFLRHVE